MKAAKNARRTNSVRKGKPKNRGARLMKLQAERRASERE